MQPPSTRPNVAVLGCGYWGRNLVRNFAELGALGLVCERSEIGRAIAADLAPQCAVIADPAELWDSPVQGVVIATPAETHFEYARRALLAGKDVLCEKPLALNYAHGAELTQLASERGRVLMVGHVLEYHPGITKLHCLVNSGDLGTLRYIYSSRLSSGKVRRNENILWSFAPHDIAIILRMIGAMPIQVAASGGSYIHPGVADVTVTNMLFDVGVRAHIHVSWLHPFKEQRLVVIGSRKVASFDDVAKELVLYDQDVDTHGEEPPMRRDGEHVAFGHEEPLKLECEAFLAAMESRRSPLTDGASGLRVLKVLEAAQRSLVMNGEPVGLPVGEFE